MKHHLIATAVTVLFFAWLVSIAMTRGATFFLAMAVALAVAIYWLVFDTVRSE